MSSRLVPVLALLSSCAPSTDPIPSRGAGPAARLVGTCSGATHATIQDAIDAAVDLDIIEICPGTYLEALVIENKTLTLTPVFGPGTVTLSGEFTWRPVTITNGANATIEDLLIHFGYDATIGGNIHCRGSDATVNLYGNEINDGFAPIGGGLGTDEQCHGWVEGNEFRDNGATWGGAAYIEADEDVFNFNDNFVNGNAAVYGGGVYTDGSAPVSRNDITVNFATGDGGGVYGINNDPGGQIFDNTITGNVADGNGGGIYLSGGEGAAVVSNDISDNTASSGGGVYADDVPISFRNLILDGNSATESGGAMELEDVTGEILNSVVYENAGPGGAGFRVRNSPTLDIRNNVFFRNLESAALRVSGGQPIVAYNDFRTNSPNFAGMPNVVGVDGNLSVTPRFVHPAVGNFHLRSTSQLIDAGDPAILDVDATRSDIGPFGGPDAIP